MAARTQRKAPAAEVGEIERTADLLGGPKVFRHRLRHPLDVHEVLSRGLPRVALTHLISKVLVLRNPASLEQAVGVSLRTFQRFKLTPEKPLSKEQSGRAWKFAEILAKATEVFGSQQEGGTIPVYGQLMAAALVCAVPVVALYLAFQRYLVGGLTAGGVK